MRAIALERAAEAAAAAADGTAPQPPPPPPAAGGTGAADDAAAGDLLIFGNRHRARDFLYEDEWSRLAVAPRPLDVLTAWSRDPPRRTLVTDVLREPATARRVAHALLARGGYCYVAGSARMASDVRATLEAVIAAAAGLSERHAAAALRKLERERRFCVEAWS